MTAHTQPRKAGSKPPDSSATDPIPAPSFLEDSTSDPASRTNSLRRTTASIGTATPPPPPPRRPKTQRDGSVHTAYYPPQQQRDPSFGTEQPSIPLSYESHGETYRDPVALPTSPAQSMPDLVESTVDDWPSSIEPSGWDAPPDHPDQYNSWANLAPEEEKWWDKSFLLQGRVKPGPGYLPSAMLPLIHPWRHDPLRVSVSVPDLVPEPPRSPTTTSTSHPPPSPTTSIHSSTTPSRSAATKSPSRSSLPVHQPPLRQEIFEAIPHPHAYFCTRENGWVLLCPSSSAFLPPLAVDPALLPHPLPDDSARRMRINCLEKDTHPMQDQTWAPHEDELKSHHYHRYRSAVKGSSLKPPFCKKYNLPPLPREHWEDSMDTDIISDHVTEDDEIYLDLFVCCQCQTHILATPPSVVIPTVIPPQVLTEFKRDRVGNPSLGKNGPETYVLALETILKIIENLVWKLRLDAIKVKTSNALVTKIGWSLIVRQLFEALGFNYTLESDAAPGQLPTGRLNAPFINTSAPSMVLNRAKLLRAWVEIGVLTQDLRRRYSQDVRNLHTSQKLWTTITSGQQEMIAAVGAHPDQMPPTTAIDPASLPAVDRQAWEILGTTAETHSAEMVEFAYNSQTHCDPSETIQYFTCLDRIRHLALLARHPSHDALEVLFRKEQSRGRWTSDDLLHSADLLNLLNENREVRSELTGDMIRDAWRLKLREVKDALNAFESGGVTNFRAKNKDELELERQRLKDAFRIVAESTGDATIMANYEEALKLYGNAMDAKEAYSTMEVPSDFDEDTLLTVYAMRVQDQPLLEERMKQALMAIAEDRGSERLRRYAETGFDGGPPPPDSSRPDWPRGLEQLGNTCYLNSLLQYFYTIKDLRSTILDLRAEASESSLINEADLKQNRVGGRLVSKREVERSKQFVNHLSHLFFDLAWTEMPSVKPELELAKLALVTSKDEEEEAKSEGSDATAASGSTLVDEPISTEPLVGAAANDSNAVATGTNPTTVNTPSTPSARVARSTSPPSVLGKRPAGGSLSGERGRLTRSATMEVESSTLSKGDIDRDGFVLVDTPNPEGLKRAATVSGRSTSTAKSSKHDQDVEMTDENQPPTGPIPEPPNDSKKPPPLPPRKSLPLQPRNDSVMMFGKQHDVSECMDNCMFQIEAALKFFPAESDKSAEAAEERCSIIKKLFYGKIRQRIRMLPDPDSLAQGPVHEREDLFSQLLINVADEGFDLHDGLAGYFDDNVEYQGKQARMETAIKELPPILQIQLQRVQFNREAMEAYKSQAYVKYEESLFMDRFMSDADPEKRERSKALQAEMTLCRERMQALTANKSGPYDEPLSNTLNFLTTLHTHLQAQPQPTAISSLDHSLIAGLQVERATFKAEMTECRATLTTLKRELEALWKDDRKIEYELCAVFVHRGASPSFGHYFFYARQLPDKPDSWFKYNDQDVTAVRKEEVLADSTGSTANPYLLVFARKGSGVIETVHRVNTEDLLMES